ncbi:MAG TPA: L-ribulose-5-phosphate 4-epimerase AraD [Silvibacterium sp.]|nr:L-ribulose-5-phosphate 4-epimerase AraD [Silvibacterium sp.]
MLSELKQQVLEANLALVKHGLVMFTFGNASGIDRGEGLVVIKPSGVPYEKLRPEHMVVTDMHGKVVEGSLKPSSDLATHIFLYREFPAIGGVAHTHSEHATAWAQAGKSIPSLGTTHADYFYGEIPVTDELSDEDIVGDYVHNTGAAIVRRFAGVDPMSLPAVLVAGHAPFTWGKTPLEAAEHSALLELVARLAYRTLTINAECREIPRALQDLHYFRKHGEKSSYGQ